jgi:hypothetical protein
VIRLLLRIGVTALLLVSAPAAAAFAQGHQPEPGYLDDRSTPEAVLGSYFDAVNRREYARAYGYWEPAAAAIQLAPFDQFAAGYADTAWVDLSIGDVGTGVGAGQLYFSVPVTLRATLNNGSGQTFVGCYILHLSRPVLQAVPPFHPLGIQRASVQQVDDDADTASLMASACPAV